MMHGHMSDELGCIFSCLRPTRAIARKLRILLRAERRLEAVCDVEERGEVAFSTSILSVEEAAARLAELEGERSLREKRDAQGGSG